MREAAEVLAPVRDDVIVIGAVAVQVALDGHAVALTPTRDVDGAVKTDRIDAVVAQLKAAELQPSALPHERGFTWVKGDLKVQLLRPYHPFPKGAAKGLPISNLIPELDQYRVLVAFDDPSEAPRFWSATAAALVALKEIAFGRSRPDGGLVERDFSDVALMLDRVGEEIAAEVRTGSPMLARVRTAAERLTNEETARAAAARELVRMGEQDSQGAAELAVGRTAQRFLRKLDR